jgi:hypothetical protein
VELAKKEDKPNLDILDAVVESIRSSILCYFNITVELAKLLFISKTHLTNEVKTKLTYGVMVYGPLNSVSLWSKSDFTTYLKMGFGAMYLEVLDLHKNDNFGSEETILKFGPLVELYSPSIELN